MSLFLLQTEQFYNVIFINSPEMSDYISVKLYKDIYVLLPTFHARCFLPRDASAERGYEIAFVCLSVCDV